MATTDKINLLSRVASIDVAPEFAAYSKVVIHLDDEKAIEVGDDTGRTLEVTNPFGTQEMAQQMLASLRGYQYQPLYATGALLDPAAEIGDGVSIKGIYGGIYQRMRTFNQLMATDIAAPHDEEINHEYKYVSPQERKYRREMGSVRASLLVQADRITAEVTQREADSAEFRSQLSIQATQIAAKVSESGGNNVSNSFSWSLTARGHYWYANGSSDPVFSITKDGARVRGEIRATTGVIGGFTIGDRAIYNNISKFGGTQTTGVYLGTNGIQLGQNFRVSSSGNVTANNMTLTGTLKVGGQNITAENLRIGAAQSASNYSSWNSARNSVNANGQTWSTGAGYGYNFDSMKNGGAYAYPINASSFRIQGTQYTPQSMSFKDYYGNTRTISYLGVASG